MSERPHGVVKNDNRLGKLGRDVDKETEGEGKGEAGGRGREVGREEGQKVREETELAKEEFSRSVNNDTERENMDDGVFTGATVAALVHRRAREVVLVSHTARGGEGVAEEGEV